MAVVIAALGLIGVGGNVASAQLLDGPPFEVHPDVAAARVLWDAVGPDAYTYTRVTPYVGDVPDDLLNNPPTTFLTVDGDVVTGVPADRDEGAYISIDELFDQLQAGEFPVTEIRFDAELGYPTYVYSCFDVERRRCGELRNSDLVAIDAVDDGLLDGPPFEVHPDVAASRALWDAVGPDAYTYTRVTPYVGDVPDDLLNNPPTTFLTVDGDVVTGVPADRAEGAYISIDELFDQLEAGEFPVTEIRFDAELGYPTYVYSCFDVERRRCGELRNSDLAAIEPIDDDPPFVSDQVNCVQRGNTLSWTDIDKEKYWIYAADGPDGEQYWIGRTLGETTFVVPRDDRGNTYFIHALGISRQLCTDEGIPDDRFECEAFAGRLSWDDQGRARYQIFKSSDDGVTWDFLGQVDNRTTFVDHSAGVGAIYKVRFGVAEAPCTTTGEPPFSCQHRNGKLRWSDHGQSLYWVYRSDDGGASYEWIGRTLGATSFRDRNTSASALYQVHYDGIPRIDCTNQS